MKNLSLSILLCILSLVAISQESYEGMVYDVGMHEKLGQVLVQSPLTGLTATTSDSGLFVIPMKSFEQKEHPNQDSYSFLKNTLYWDFPESVSISMYSMNGNTLFSNNFQDKGHFTLQVPASGYYAVILQTSEQQIKFLLFSDGSNLILAQKKNFNSPTPLYDSSLIFTKTNYFTREIQLPEKGTPFNVPLLKKAYDQLDYFNELISYEAFCMLDSSPPISNYGEVQSIKALYDFVNDRIYYSNVKKYPSHFSFAEAILGYEHGSSAFFYSQYNNLENRFLNLITINYHTTLDKYVFEFVAYDLVDCEGITDTYNKLMETAYFDNKLYFYVNNERWRNCLDIPTITSEELYQGQNYQALNLEEGYGYLRKIDINELSASSVGKHDLILLNGIPNDVSVVSGIITTEFQTALSHVNILSHNRQTPNMALKDGWTNTHLDSLMGDLVYLKVESNNFTIRKASLNEATEFWNAREPHTPIVLEKDIETSGLFELDGAGISSLNTIGAKAANFAELVNLGSIPVPENYFAIPFYYYQQHMTEHGIDTIIDQLLHDDQLLINLEYRKNKLSEVQHLILEAPINPELLSLVLSRINYFNEFEAVRFRSSTNAEDLEYFNGAGLYDSYSAKKGHATKTAENAIKKVWASLWNLRAFDEREYYKIDQNSVAMGILVHRSFPDEDANGVIITKNMYNVNHGYTINVQYKEFSIVYPEPGIMHDQIITYTINLENNHYTIEYLSHSNRPELDGATVLTDEEVYILADYCTTIKNYYFDYMPHQGNCAYNDFAVDIEFKVDSQVEERKIYIKQVRLYSSN